MGWKLFGSCVCAGRLWRLEDYHCFDFRLFSKRKRGIFPDCAFRKHRSFTEQPGDSWSSSASDFLSALYPVCGSHCVCKTRTGWKMGSSYGAGTVCDCMDSSFCYVSSYTAVYVENGKKIKNKRKEFKKGCFGKATDFPEQPFV